MLASGANFALTRHFMRKYTPFTRHCRFSSSTTASVASRREQPLKTNEQIAQQFHRTETKLTWAQIADIAKEQEDAYFQRTPADIAPEMSNAVEIINGPIRIFFEGIIHFLERDDIESAEETLNKAKLYDPTKASALEPLFMIFQSLIAMKKNNFVGARAGLEHGLSMIANRITHDNCRIIILANRELSRFYKDKFVGKTVEENKSRPDKVVQHANRAYMLAEEFFGWTDKFTIELAMEAARVDFSFSRVDIGIMILEKMLVAIEFLPKENFDLETLTDIGTMLSRAYDRRKYYRMGESAIKRVQNLILKRKDIYTDTERLEQCLFKLDNRRTIARFMNEHDYLALRKFKQLDERAYQIGTKWIESNPYEALFEIALMKYFKGYAMCTIVMRGAKVQTAQMGKGQKFEYVQDKDKAREMIRESIVSFEGAKTLFQQLEDKHWIRECETMIEQMTQDLESM